MDPDIEAVLSLSSMSVKVTFDLASSKAAVAVDVISASSGEASCVAKLQLSLHHALRLWTIISFLNCQNIVCTRWCTCDPIAEVWKPSFSSGNILSTQWMDTPVGESSGSGSLAEGALTAMEGDDVGDGIEAIAV